MNEAKRLSELAQFCRRIADDQQDPNVLDMLHDLEQDLVQKAKALERRIRRNISGCLGASLRRYVTVGSSRGHESASRSERETRRSDTSTRSSSRRMSSIV